MANGQSLNSGDKVANYSIVRLIGKGGMGEVYEAIDENLHRRVALKIISPQYSRDPDITTRFELEGRTLAKVSHNNLVMVYAFGQHEGIYYIAMEYVEGRSLAQCITAGAFHPKDAIPLFLQMLDGVQYLHSIGIIHRDLKSQNMILRPDSTIKVVDFGIAKNFGDGGLDLTRAGEFIGSAHYSAPEVVSSGTASFQSDIWSLGVIFYEMLVGKKPFRGKTFYEVMDKVKNRAMAFPPSAEQRIPADLRRLIKQMCEKTVQLRARDISALQNELVRILDDINSSALPADDATERVLISQRTKTLTGAGSTTTQSSPRVPAPGLDEEIPTQAPPAEAADFSEAGSFESLVTRRSPFAFLGSMKRGVSAALALAIVAAASWYFLNSSGSMISDISLEVPAPGARISLDANRPSIAFTWSNSKKGPVHLQIASDREFKNLTVDEKVKSSPFSVSKLRTEGVYYWRIMPKSPGAAPLPANQFLLLDSRGPALIRPLGDVLLSQSEDWVGMKFSWQPKIAAPKYRVQVARDAAFSRLVQDVLASEPEAEQVDLAPGTYFWRVKVEGRQGVADEWSEIGKFNIGGEAATVTAANPSPLPAPAPAASRRQTRKSTEAAPRLKQAKVSTVLRVSSNSRDLASVNGIKNAPDLQWAEVPGASRYELEISADPDFDSTLVNLKTSEPHYLWSSARPGSYFWRVRAETKSGGGNFSAPGTVDVKIPPPALKEGYSRSVKVTSPREFSSSKTPVTIEWQAVPFSEKYQFVVAEDPEFNRTVASVEVASPQATVQLGRPGQYYIRLAGMNRKGQLVSDYSSSKIQFERKLALALPEIKAPQNGAIVLSGGKTVPIVFIWKSVPDVQYYEIQFAVEPSFKKPIFSTRVNDARYLYSGTFPKAWVYWRVRAGWSQYQSDWTKPYRLRQRN